MLVVEGNHGLEGFQKRIICADYPVNYSMDDAVDYSVDYNRFIFINIVIFYITETKISSRQITLQLE
jgi:hypothetical protein